MLSGHRCLELLYVSLQHQFSSLVLLHGHPHPWCWIAYSNTESFVYELRLHIYFKHLLSVLIKQLIVAPHICLTCQSPHTHQAFLAMGTGFPSLIIKSDPIVLPMLNITFVLIPAIKYGKQGVC